MSNPYAGDKALYHRQSLHLLANGEQPYPVHVQVILSDLCNHSCSFCAYRWEGYTSNELFHVIEDGQRNNNPNRMIPFTKVMEILGDCKAMRVKAIQFTGGGEPTVHPDHPQIFQSTLDMGFDAALVTNGTRWLPGVVDTLSQFKWVRFSLDAGCEETYAQIRKVSKQKFHTCLDHVRQLADAKQRDKSDVVIGVGFVVTKDNWQEVISAARLAREAGADNFRISAVFQPDDEKYFTDFHEPAAHLCRVAAAYTTPKFTVSNMFGERLEDLTLAHPDYEFCGVQHFTTYIGGDQNVYRCCNLAYHPRGLIGSIKDMSFKLLWDSAEKRDKMESFDAHGCPRCQFNQKNRVIGRAVREENHPPTHVNFV